MNKYKETFETWNKVASLYQEKFMDLDLYNKTYDYLCNTLIPNAKILEIGCGPGNITKYLLNKRPDLHIHGIDIAPNMIELARVNNPKAHFDVMDTRDIEQFETTFDSIICGFCLPYLSSADSEKLLSDSYRLLNENGILYLSFVEGDPAQSGFKTGSTGDRSYFYYHSLETLQSLLIQNNFEDLDTFKIGYPRPQMEDEIHTILIVKKNERTDYSLPLV
jgi:ubiquinone/menaquinone biosynthesis C-methylase UbiE